MNIYLFLESLSDQERQELKDYFLRHDKAKSTQKEDVEIKKVKIQDFIREFANDISPRLFNALYQNGEYPFLYVNDIRRSDFYRIRNAGKKSWQELESILIENDLTYRKN